MYEDVEQGRRDGTLRPLGLAFLGIWTAVAGNTDEAASVAQELSEMLPAEQQGYAISVSGVAKLYRGDRIAAADAPEGATPLELLRAATTEGRQAETTERVKQLFSGEDEGGVMPQHIRDETDDMMTRDSSEKWIESWRSRFQTAASPESATLGSWHQKIDEADESLREILQFLSELLARAEPTERWPTPPRSDSDYEIESTDAVEEEK